MTFVVVENCIKCKFIDCTLSEPECPAEAIFSEDELPDEMESFVGLNTELALRWPIISEAKHPPEDADHWNTGRRKLNLLER